MASEAPRLQSLVDSKPASLQALQATMRSERFEVVQYLVLEASVIVWHIGPDSVTAHNVFLPRTQVMSKVASLQKSLSDRNTKFDETTARELFLFLIQPVLGRDSQRAPRHHPARGPELRAVPGLSKSGGWSVPRANVFTSATRRARRSCSGFKRSTTLAGARLFGVADPAHRRRGRRSRRDRKPVPRSQPHRLGSTGKRKRREGCGWRRSTFSTSPFTESSTRPNRCSPMSRLRRAGRMMGS